MDTITNIDYQNEIIELSSGNIIPLDRFLGKVQLGRAVFINEEGKFYSIEVEIDCPTCGSR